MLNNRFITHISSSVSLKCLREYNKHSFSRRTITLNHYLLSRQISVATRYRIINHNIAANSSKAAFILSPTARMAASWSMGPGTFEVPLSLFEKNRKRLASKLKSGQVVVLQGGEDINHYDTDVQYVFRQVSTDFVPIVIM